MVQGKTIFITHNNSWLSDYKIIVIELKCENWSWKHQDHQLFEKVAKNNLQEYLVQKH